MIGSHRISVQNKRIRYDFTIRRNLTIIRGDSATGKTTLIDMIQEYYENGSASGIQLHSDKKCVVLSGRDWEAKLSIMKDSIVFIDEGNEFIFTNAFASHIQNTDNYYVFVTREAIPSLPYSIEEIYGIRKSGKYDIRTMKHRFCCFRHRQLPISIGLAALLATEIILNRHIHAFLRIFSIVCNCHRNTVLSIHIDAIRQHDYQTEAQRSGFGLEARSKGVRVVFAALAETERSGLCAEHLSMLNRSAIFHMLYLNGQGNAVTVLVLAVNRRISVFVGFASTVRHGDLSCLVCGICGVILIPIRHRKKHIDYRRLILDQLDSHSRLIPIIQQPTIRQTDADGIVFPQGDSRARNRGFRVRVGDNHEVAAHDRFAVFVGNC